MQKNKPNSFTDVTNWLFDKNDWKLLLRSIPGLVTALSILSVTIMNLMASKIVIMTPWLGVTGGVLLSWLPFLIGDIVVKTFGAKAATKLNILGLGLNLACIAFFQLIASVEIGVEPGTYDAFNSVFRQTWQIFVASSIAFLVSGIVNNFTNAGIGKLFKENKDSKAEYMTRTYISTMLGQFVDNFVFTGLAFLVFFKLSIGTTLGYTMHTVIGTSILGALLELLMEVIFSPIGYEICKKWRKEEVGATYLEYCKTKELVEDIGRINY